MSINNRSTINNLLSELMSTLLENRKATGNDDKHNSSKILDASSTQNIMKSVLIKLSRGTSKINSIL